jgi:hypothetical protein
MIHSTSPFDRTTRPDPAGGATGSPRPAVPGPDRFSPRQAGALQAALQAHPEVRSEVVARGRQIAADPAYPSEAVMARVAAVLLAQPDLTAD